MNILFLSMIYCLFFSNNINASHQPPIKKSGWSWPILQTIGIVKTKKQVEATTIATQSLTKNLSDNSLRKSIAEDGFDAGHLDEDTVISSDTEPNTPTPSVQSNSTSPTSSKKTILHTTVSADDTTETHSPLQTCIILPAEINLTISSKSSSPREEALTVQNFTQEDRDSKLSTTELINTALIQQKIQELPPLALKRTELTTKPGLYGRRLFLDSSTFSDFENDCSQTSNSNSPITLQPLEKKDVSYLEQGKKLSSPALNTLKIETSETSSCSNDIKNLCSRCFKKKNPQQ